MSQLAQMLCFLAKIRHNLRQDYVKTHTMKLPKARKRGDAYRIELMFDGKRYSATALLHKDLKCKAPLIELNLRRNLGKWST
mgnify:FL=1